MTNKKKPEPAADKELAEKLEWEQLRTAVFMAVGNYRKAYGFQHTLNLLTTAIHTCYKVEDIGQAEETED